MAKALKKVFKVKDKSLVDGKEVEREVELAVRIPTANEKDKARRIHAKAWRQAVEEGAIMREALDRHLRDQKLWDDLRQRDYDKLRNQILDGERRIKMGGNAGLTKNQARELALNISDWRDDLAELLTEKNRVDANTADALADQAQFNYFVSTCTVYNDTGKPYFSPNGNDPSVDSYIDKSTENVGYEAASKFAEIWYGTNEDSSVTLPEKKFLKEYGFADDKGRLINKQGKLVDRKGRLINEEGRFIDENGKFVDADGIAVDKDGQYIVDFAPFLDDENEESPSPASPPKVEDSQDKIEEKEPVST